MKFLTTNLLIINLFFITLHLQATQITFFNNSQSNVFISDHLTVGHLITPQGSCNLNSHNPTTLYLYLEKGPSKKFSMMYRIKELKTSSTAVTINYEDVVSKKIMQLYPEQFSITHQIKIAFEQQQAQRHQEIQTMQQSPAQKIHVNQMYQQQKQPPFNKPHHQPTSHEATLNNIIDQVKKIQEQKGGAHIADMLKAAHQPIKSAPYKMPSKNKRKD